MTWLRELFHSVRGLFQKEKLDREMDEELRFHIERQTEANVQAGMKPEEARYAALRKFGWMESIRKDCRNLHRVRWIEDLLTDVRFSVRMLKNHPGFTTVAVLSLALGIGGTTGIFGVVNAVLLNPLPQKDPQRLVEIQSFKKGQGWPRGISPQTWQELWQMGTFFSDLVVDAGEGLFWEADNFLELVDGARVSPNFFGFWQLRPQLGRTFTPEEGKLGESPVIILSHEFWQNQCRGRPEIVGQSIHFKEEVFTVIGVMPPHVWGEGTRFWIPFRGPILGLSKELGEDRDYRDRNYGVAARLQPGVTTQQLQAALDTIAQRQATDSPETSRAWTLRARPLRLKFSDEHLQRTLLSLFGAVGFVLLIACANIANLLLARNEARQRELAVRVAIGAGRWRLVRQLLTECIVLAVLGGTCGLMFSWWAARLLTTFIPFYLRSVKPIGFDTSMLGFTLVLSLGVGIALGLIPAWLACRRRLDESLKSSAPLASLSLGRKVGGGLLVISELALAVVLLTGAGLMVNSVVRLLHVNPGFDPTNLLKVDAWVVPQGRTEPQKTDQFILQIQERFTALPGVEAVGVALNRHQDFPTEEYQPEGHNTPIKFVLRATGVGTSSELKAMRVPLLSGRFLGTLDGREGQNTVLINETLARRCWPGEAAVGKRLRSLRIKDKVLEVVGVVGDIRDDSYDQYVGPICYIPFESYPLGSRQLYSLFVRTRVDPVSLIATLRREMQAMGPSLRTPAFEVVTQSLYKNTAQRRLYMGCLSGFAAIGVILSVIGIYGVLAWTVTRRTKEIGVRMACGASPTQALGLVLRQGLFITSIGIVLGVAGAMVLTRFLSSYLFGVGPLDPVTFSGASLLLGAVALLACYVPARRAARIDPMKALRYE